MTSKLYSLEDVKKQIKENIKNINIPNGLKVYILRDVLCKINIVTSSHDSNTINYDDIFSKIFKDINEEWIGETFIGEDDILENTNEEEIIPLNKLANENIFWVEKIYHLESWKSYSEKPREANPENTKAKVICFYSYKGGVGRTTLASFTAAELSQKYDKRVVIIDADIEAPGLIYQYFGKDFELSKCKGLIDFFLYPGDINPNEFKENFLLSHELNNKNLFLMPASSEFFEYNKLRKFPDKAETSISENYFQKIGRLSLIHDGSEARDRLLNLINESIKPDLILVDLRTGLTDIGGLFTSDDISDLNVFVGYPDNQTLPGLDFFIKNSKLSINIDENFLMPKVLFVHSPAARDEAGEVYQKNKDDFRTLINQFIGQSSSNRLTNLDESTDPIFFDIPYQQTLRAKIFSNGIMKVHKDNMLNPEFKPYQDFSTRVFELLIENKMEEETEKLEYSEEIDDQVNNQSDREIKYGDSLKTELMEGFKKNPLFREGEKVAYSETDLATDDLFKLNFQYFKDDFDNLLKDDKFVIIGDKGTGKTTLKMASEKEEIVRSFNKDLSNISLIYITAIGENDFQATDLKAKEYDALQNRKFWRYHTFEILKYYAKNKDKLEKDDRNRRKILMDCIEKFTDIEISDEDFLKIHNDSTKRIIFVYDYLDQTNTKYKELRNNSIQELIFFWKFFSSDRITAKIFLRNDIMNQFNYDDISKIKSSNTYTLNWTFDKLMAVFFKRLISRSDSLKRIFIEKEKIDIQEKKGLGIIFPDDPTSINKSIEAFFGEKIGQQTSRNWLERFLWIGQFKGDQFDGSQENKLYNVRFMLNFLGGVLKKAVAGNYFVVNRRIRNKCPLKLNLYDGKENGLFTKDKNLYGELSKEWVSNEFIIMNPSLKEPINKIRECIFSETNKFTSLNRGEFSQNDLNKVIKLDTSEIENLEKSGFFYKEERKQGLFYSLPEVYRAYLGIKKQNALPPYLGKDKL